MLNMIAKEKDRAYLEEGEIIRRTLEEYIIERGNLSAEEIYSIAIKVCEAIKTINGLSPHNIYRNMDASQIVIYKSSGNLLVSLELLKIRQGMYEDYKLYLNNSKFDEKEMQLLNNISKQNDLHTLGRVIYFMSTGKKPLSVLEPIIKSEALKDIDEKIIDIIKKCFNEGYDSIEDVIKELRDCIYLISRKQEMRELTSIRVKDTISLKPVRITRRERAKSKNKITILKNYVCTSFQYLSSIMKVVKWRIIYR